MSDIRAGKFFLKQRGKKGLYRICWYDPKTRQTNGIPLGTADVRAAEQKLYEHALHHDRPVAASDDELAAVLSRYLEGHAKKLPSAGAFRIAMRAALQFWPEANISLLRRNEQLKFIAAKRAEDYADWTIQNMLGRIWAAMSWAQRDNEQLVIPTMVTADDWKPLLENRERVYTPEELGRLLSAAAAHEHWWRYVVLAIGTAGRVTAIRELKWQQVDLRVGRIALNPEGRVQTKKRRAIVPIAPTLASELEGWRHGAQPADPVLGREVLSREFFDALMAKTGLDGGTNAIRHTVRTWMAELDVPDGQADMFMGHKGHGSHTGARYTHRRPEYLCHAKAAVESLYAAIAPHVQGRALRGDRVTSQVPELQQLIDSLSAA